MKHSTLPILTLLAAVLMCCGCNPVSSEMPDSVFKDDLSVDLDSLDPNAYVSYVWMTIDGYSLELSIEDALHMGMTADQYKLLSSQVRRLNRDFKEYLSTLPDDESTLLFFPHERVKALPDRRLILAETPLLESVVVPRPPLTLPLGGFEATTSINGGPSHGSAIMPEETRIVSCSAYTQCLFGFFSGVINAGGRHQNYNGSGINPASGQIAPGQVPGGCEGTIGSTGCQATLKVYFLKGQD